MILIQLNGGFRTRAFLSRLLHYIRVFVQELGRKRLTFSICAQRHLDFAPGRASRSFWREVAGRTCRTPSARFKISCVHSLQPVAWACWWHRVLSGVSQGSCMTAWRLAVVRLFLHLNASLPGSQSQTARLPVSCFHLPSETSGTLAHRARAKGNGAGDFLAPSPELLIALPEAGVGLQAVSNFVDPSSSYNPIGPIICFCRAPSQAQEGGQASGLWPHLGRRTRRAPGRAARAPHLADCRLDTR